MTFSPFFFFFVSHLSFSGFFSLSLTLSLTAHQIRLAIRNIPTSNPFATSQHWTHLQRSLLPNPFTTIPFATIPIHDDLVESFTVAAKSFVVLVAFACSSLLLLAVVTFARHCHICSPSSLLLAVVTFACSSSLKLARRRWSLIVVVDQTLATFRLPPTLTLQLPFADSAPTALQLPPTPTVRLPFTDSNPRDPSASTSTDDPSPSLQTFFFS